MNIDICYTLLLCLTPSNSNNKFNILGVSHSEKKSLEKFDFLIRSFIESPMQSNRTTESTGKVINLRAQTEKEIESTLPCDFVYVCIDASANKNKKQEKESLHFSTTHTQAHSCDQNKNR